MGGILTGTVPPGQAVMMEPGTYHVSNSDFTHYYYNPHIDVTYKVTLAAGGGWLVVRYPYLACGTCWDKVRGKYGF